MAARNRSRPTSSRDDADEERNIWNQVKADAKQIDSIIAKSAEISEKIVRLEEDMVRDGETSAKLEELENAYRENVKLNEEALKLLGDNAESPLDGSLLSTMHVLIGLRQASEMDTHSTVLSTKPRAKRRLDTATDDYGADSPGPSPKVPLAMRKLDRQGAGSRSGSVPALREPSVKIEEPADTADSPATTISTHKSLLSAESNGTSSASTGTITSSSSTSGAHLPGGKPAKLSVGTEVFYRNKQKSVEGEGILCTVTSVIGEGKQRRYEIQDADPDPDEPSVPYRASVSALVAIPPKNDGLQALDLKKPVLALYPNTTTFYKAEVVGYVVKKADGSAVRVEEGAAKGGKGDWVRLRFEGEDEVEKEMDVERRYVLEQKDLK